MLGQRHVLKALVNALDHDRLHHAYLFTGTRGVGKTTLARILAKALNCEQGISSQPCGQCSACTELDEGRFVDLIEVDAASRTKVEETRDLLDNVQYAPTRGRFKVYLIDEVHMFSNHSFNALLKTLEEPPPHVKFLLATTDPKRLPVTILSRCLQFNLTRLSSEQLSAHLQRVASEEGVESDAQAPDLIARAAEGSVRDALSLLDQAIAHGDGRLDAGEVASMLGTIGSDRVAKLLAAVVEQDAHALIDEARVMHEYAPDYGHIMAEIMSLLRQVAVHQALGADAGESDDEAHVIELAQKISAEECQLFYQIALMGRRDLALAPDQQVGFEMTLLRLLAFKPTAPQDHRVDTGARTAAPAAVSATVAGARVDQRPDTRASVAAPDEAAVEQFDWSEIVDDLEVVGFARELARNCAMGAFDGRTVELVVAPQFEKLAATKNVALLEGALKKHFGRSVRINIAVHRADNLSTPSQQESKEWAERQLTAEAEIERDPNVKALRDAFDATVEEVSAR